MSDSRWEAFVTREPYFAVVPAAEYLRANLTPQREQEFFASGEELVSWMFEVIGPLAPGFAPVAALEYGCGAGRLALSLASRAGSVTAVDDSPAMLTFARDQAARRGLDIEFGAPDVVHATSRKFDLVVCHLPLQRMRPADGLALVETLITRIGPGGVGVFHVPYADSTPAFVRASRLLRTHLPLVNRLVNRLRGKDADAPFVPTHTYPLGAMLDRLGRTSMETSHVVLDQQTQPARATVFVRMPHLTGTVSARHRPTDHDDAGAPAVPALNQAIDVTALIASTSIDDLNRTAEQYFSTLHDWDHHLAKPFAKVEEVPPLLIDLAVLIQGLRLEPGMTVVDFGAGSGWLSRYLTQLGCRSILLDVSPTALRMAESLYARVPTIGTQPAPVFLPFDGRRIDLPDESVDRIVSFHAFHHAPNPDAMLREFSRVLKPGGLVALAEPGPHHSRSAMSQFEMRTYGVVENDVNVHALWRTARACGFADIRLAVFHQPPFHVSLAEFDDLLTGGPTGDAWLASTRRFLRNVRSFFLIKAGASRRDSRQTEGLLCQVTARLSAPVVKAGDPIHVEATVTNSGSAVWLPWPEHGGVALGAHLYDEAGTLLNFDFHCTGLVAHSSREIALGESVRLRLALPALAAGRYRIELDCVASGVTWFAQTGSRPVALAVDVE